MTSRLNPHAETVILAVPFRDAARWRAVGRNRAEAEAYFDTAIYTEVANVPMYRVVGQRKVDQHGPMSDTVQ